MTSPVSALPDDVDALKAMVLAMAREQAANEERIALAQARLVTSEAQTKAALAAVEIAEAEVTRLKAVEAAANERIANLTAIMKVLQRTQHGTRSERLRLGVSDEQVSFAFEEVETGLAALQREIDRGGSGDKPKRAPRPRKGFAAHLERIEEVIEPEIPAGCEDWKRF